MESPSHAGQMTDANLIGAAPFGVEPNGGDAAFAIVGSGAMPHFRPGQPIIDKQIVIASREAVEFNGNLLATPGSQCVIAFARLPRMEVFRAILECTVPVALRRVPGTGEEEYVAGRPAIAD